MMDFDPLLHDLRTLYHFLKACNVNYLAVLRALFRSHLSRLYPFCNVALPFDLGIRETNFKVCFVGTFPETPIQLERVTISTNPSQTMGNTSGSNDLTPTSKAGNAKDQKV